MMKPAGSPPTCVSSLPVVGFFHASSELCSARVIVILISGPSGVTVPPLFMRGTRFAGSTPSDSSDWFQAPGREYGNVVLLGQIGGVAGVVGDLPERIQVLVLLQGSSGWRSERDRSHEC